MTHQLRKVDGGLHLSFETPVLLIRTSSSSIALVIENHPFGSQTSAGNQFHRLLALRPSLTTGLPLSR
jgi:hypothetical protein